MQYCNYQHVREMTRPTGQREAVIIRRADAVAWGRVGCGESKGGGGCAVRRVSAFEAAVILFPPMGPVAAGAVAHVRASTVRIARG
jgi:hypothetical protein